MKDEEQPPKRNDPDPEMRVIVMQDVVESVLKMHSDEKGYISLWHEFLSWAVDSIQQHDGRLVKTLGDGVRAVFTDAAKAVSYSLKANAWSENRATLLDNDSQLQFRTGIHYCDVFMDGDDVYGNGVNLAARLAELGRPGDVILSAAVTEFVVDGLDGYIEDLGNCYLRHINEPVRSYRISAITKTASEQIPPEKNESLSPLLAVLPFDYQGFSPGEERLGSILAERIIYQIANRAGLEVLSLLSTNAVSGRGLNCEALGQHLGANFIVSGSYRLVRGMVVAAVELVEATSARVLWTNQYQFEQDELLLIESSVITSIVVEVHDLLFKVSERKIREWPLRNIASHEILMGAVSTMHRAGSAEFDNAGKAFEHLVEQHRRNPIPHAWMANWHVLRVTRGIQKADSQLVPRALGETQRALDLDPMCSLALTMEGFIQCHMIKDLGKARDRYDQALQANPSESLAWLLRGVLDSFEGKAADAESAADQALKLSPLNPIRYFYLSLAASAILPSKKYERVIELASESIRLNRFHPSTYRVLILAQALNGDGESARQSVQTLLSLEPDFTVKRFLERSPVAATMMGPICAEAFREAGVPEA